MPFVGCTRFPSLNCSNEVPTEPATREVLGLQTTKECLLRSWARLLSAYSGEKDEVVFDTDKGMVKIDLLSGSIEGLDDIHNGAGRETGTGVYFGEPTQPHGLALEFHYDERSKNGLLFTDGHIPLNHLEQVDAQIRTILAHVSMNSDGEAMEISKSHLALSIVNQKYVKLPGPRLLHELVLQHKHSNKLAIDFRSKNEYSTKFTYSDLYSRSERLAMKIRTSIRRSASSAQPIIPLFIPQSTDLYIAMLAVLRSGCAFCPLHLDAPPDWLRFVLEDISASVVLSVPAFQSKLSQIAGIECLLVDEGSTEHSISANFQSLYQVKESNNAYVMYTSGSTGKPKGVPVSHQAATQSLLAHDRHIPNFSRFLQFAAPTFDVSLFEIFFTFFRKSTLVGSDRSDLLADLPAVMRALNVDAAELTPTVAAGLLQRRANVPSLKVLLTIGEMLTPAVIEEFGGSESQESILWGMYGPTEAAIHCTLQPAFSSYSRPTNIGVPLETVSAFIVAPVDDKVSDFPDIKILPLGQVGELALGGYQLASGYLNRPEQTASAFISSTAYGRLYRTGDKARILPDLTIECLGRISSGQIKLRGQRIETGEVQHAATRARGCRDAVASVVNGTLVVFGLAETGAVAADDILDSCRKWLPKYMVPGDIVLMDEFPCLPSGKVDKVELESRYALRIGDLHESVIAGSPAESAKEICDIIERITRRKIHRTQSLATSGIDSLSAIQAASALRDAGFSVTALDLLTAESISKLYVNGDLANKRANSNGNQDAVSRFEVAMFSELGPLIDKCPVVGQSKDEISRITTCTPLQLSMLAETSKEPTAYCNVVEIGFPANTTISDVERHVKSLAEHNEILRSGFCHLESSTHPFALIVWKELSKEQLRYPTDPDVGLEMRNENCFLRPIRFHIQRHDLNEADVLSLRIHLHHALYDGWSVDLILDDLDFLILGRPLKPRAPFWNVARYFGTVDPSSSIEYWQEHLNDYKPTAIPNFNGRMVEEPCFESQRFNFEVPYDCVQACADAHNVGPQTLFQAALAYILSLYLDTPEVVLGTVTSGRTIPIPGIEDIIGPCVTSLPLRVNVLHAKRAIDLIKSIHHLNRQMLHHSAASIRSIKRSCSLNSADKLWDVLFVWQETLESRRSTDRSVILVESSDELESAVTFEVEPCCGHLRGKVTYHSSIFPRPQVLLLLKQVDALVGLIVNFVDAPLAGLSEKLPTSCLSVANPKPDILPLRDGLAAGIEKHAEHSPENIAVLFATSFDPESHTTLTYEELDNKATQLSNLLHDRVDPSAELVCVCMEKSLDLYIAILAVIKTGRGYLPITPTTPPERIKTILRKADIGLCLSQSNVSTNLKLRDNCDVVDLDNLELSHYSVERKALSFDGSRLAYAVFTSGSTGMPKGVLVTQQNILSNLAVLSKLYPTSPGDRLLQACSQAFDVSVFEIFFTWSVGMCLCAATNDVLFADLERSIQSFQVTHLSLTPTVAALIDPVNTPTVRFLVTAGEAVTEKVWRDWAGRGVLYQGYGPSETTNICTVKPMVSTSDLINNLGPPLENTSAFVLRPMSDEILPSGALGELCFGGDQVFRGYLNDPKLTNSKFIDHPRYGRLYRSGDNGRFLPDESILFAGRIDDQIKIRGQRIELGEINRCILRSDRIQDCVTLVFLERRSKVDTLITFCVPRGQDTIELNVLPISSEVSTLINSVYDNLTSSLPNYMVPSVLIPISIIPRTGQGKVDKRKLISLFGELDENILESTSRSFKEHDEDNEWTEAERKIAEAVARTVNLPVDKVKRQTSFLSLGLDSISAILLSKTLHNSLKAKVLVSTILRNPTVARLARIQGLNPEQDERSKTNLSSVFSDDQLKKIRKQLLKANLDASTNILPCTPLQEAMLSASDSGSPSLYCNTILFKVQQGIDDLKECWNALVSRHQILRTSFVRTNDSVYPYAQIRLKAHVPKWISQYVPDPSVSLRKLAESKVQSNLPSILDGFEPPFFLGIIEHGSTNYHLQFSCHHALHDGAATDILLREFETLFRKEQLPEPVPYEPFLHEMISHRSDAAVHFWAESLNDFQPTVLNSRRGKHALLSQNLAIPLSSLENACQRLNISLLALIQASMAKMLYSLFDQQDTCFGNVVSGRTLPLDNIDRLVAPTFNTVPIRIDLARYDSNVELLKFIQKFQGDALSYHLTPLRSIQSRLGYGSSGLFSTLLLLQAEQLQLDPEIWSLESEFGEMDFPVILELIPHKANDTLSFHLYYETSLFSPSQDYELSNAFTRAIESCTQYPAASVFDFAGLPEEIRKAIFLKSSRPRSSLTASEEEDTTASLTPAEESIRQLLSESTHIPKNRLRPETTIHQIGIDSIGAIQLASKLRALSGMKISVADVLEKPAIKDLARLLEKRDQLGEDRPVFDFESFQHHHKPTICKELDIENHQIERIRPCTLLQRGLISQFLHSNDLYVNHVTYKTDNTWTTSNLLDAWKSVRESHDMLRTGFVSLVDLKFTFAMVTYTADCSFSNVEIVDQHIDVQTWRANRMSQFHHHLHKPPWAILVEDVEGVVCMHLTMFHGLYDAHSLNLILEDLASYKHSRMKQNPANIDPLLDGILRASFAPDAQSEAQPRREYWKDLLGNAAINQFPSLTPLQESRGLTAIYSRICSENLPKLETMCQEAGITLQAAGQAAWARLLSVYMGEPKITFGVVLSGRDTIPKAETVAFPCITTVPISALESGDNWKLLASMMEINASVRKHQFTPMKDIQRWTGHSNQALFDTIFAFQKPSNTTKTTTWTIIDEVATSEYAISLELEPRGNGDLVIRATFATNVLPNQQAQLALDQFDAFLIDFARNPRRNSGNHTITSQRKELLSIVPARCPVLPSPVKLLHQFVELRAETHPDRTAFEFANNIVGTKISSKVWTYKELDEQGNRIANYILQQSVEPGSLIAICFDKCPEASFAILGILKAGCAYVALDPEVPVARKRFIVSDSKACLILTSDRGAKRFDDSTIERPSTIPDRQKSKVIRDHKAIELSEPPIVFLDELSFSFISPERPYTSAHVAPKDMCYCLYTSGTTGIPKGCEISHENAVQAMCAFSRLFSSRWDEKSRWLQFASFHFDVSVLEQYWSWSEGICVVSAPRDLIFEDLSKTIKTLGITHIDLTPSLASLVHPDDVPKLCDGVFITGGEQLTQEILDVWGPSRAIHNGYGPTEATIGVTMYTGVPENGKPANIGKQFDNVGTYVLLPNTSTPVPRGGIGELCVSGKLVGRGYLNRPDLTKERFPFLPEFQERVYRTGDLVRLLWDGSFLFLGRIDDQVKLRGQRLEIGEIDTNIRRSEADISDVATYVLKHSQQQREQLVTFFVLSAARQKIRQIKVVHDDTSISAIQVVRNACRAALPSYMVPTHFIPLNEMPLNTNNKTDGSALKHIFNDMTSDLLQELSKGNVRDAKLSPIEKRLGGILAKFLAIDKEVIQPNSNVFELGMDSISVIGFARALKAGGFPAQPSLVMSCGTVRRLTEALTSQSRASGSISTVLETNQAIAACQHRHRAKAARLLRIKPGDIECIAPCTPLQQGMISTSLGKHDLAYFASFRYVLSDEVDLTRLRSAWMSAMSMVQVLRTQFVQTDDGYVQVVLRDMEFPWDEPSILKEVDATGFISERLAKLCVMNRPNFTRPFEVFVVGTKGKRILALNIFHGLYDGNSLPLLLHLVESFYQGGVNIDPGPHFHDVLSYGPLSINKDAERFWTQHIGATHIYPIALLDDNDNNQSDPSKVSIALDRLHGLEEIRKKLGVTDQTIIQACFAGVLQRFYADITPLGLVTSGRSIDFDGADRVIGPMFNTIPFHMRFYNRDTWRSIVERCHKFNSTVLPFQHTALRDIQKWCKVRPENPLFDTLFVFQKETSMNSASVSNDLWELVDDQSVTDYPLAFEAELKMDGSLAVTFIAQANIATRGTLEELIESFRCAIVALIENPDSPVSRTVSGLRPDKEMNSTDGISKDTEIDVDHERTFLWTEQAKALRNEISKLAVVDIATIGENLSIFELGLDSIDAIKLSSRLGKLKLDIPVSKIMKHPTIRQILEFVLTEERPIAAPKVSTVDELAMRLRNHFKEEKDCDLENVEVVLPATPLQEAMVAEMWNSNFTRYYNHDVLRISEAVDIEKLERAWRTVFDATPILRTDFRSVTDPAFQCSLAQIISKRKRCSWEEISCSNRDDIDNVLKEIELDVAQHQIEGDYFRLTFVQSTSGRLLIISLPHAFYDGWSLSLLHYDVQEAYFGRALSRPSNNVVLETIFRDLTEEASSFWSDYLFQAKPCLFPNISSTDPVSGRKVHRKEKVSAQPAKALRFFCQQQKITMQALGQTCWSLVLASQVKSLEVVYGVILSGRDTEEAQEVVFPTMNTIAFRHFLTGSKNEMLQATHDSMSDIRQFQHFPLRKAQAMAETGGERLFNSLFLYQMQPDIGTSSEEKLYESVGGSSNVEYPVCVEMEVMDGALVWRVAAEDRVMNSNATSVLLDDLDLTLEGMLDNLDEKVLAFEGEQVRIGDLCPFVIPNRSSPVQQSVSNQSGIENDDKLSTVTELKLRDILSFVSSTLPNQITKHSTLFHIGLDSISAIKVSALLRKQSITLSVSSMLKASTVGEMARVIDGQQTVPRVDVMPNGPLSSPTAFEFDISKLLHDSGLTNKGLRKEDVEHFAPATAGQIYMLSTWENSGGQLFYDEFLFDLFLGVAEEDICSAWALFVARNPIVRTIFASTVSTEHPFVQMTLKLRKNRVVQDPHQLKHQEHGRCTLTLRDLVGIRPAASRREQPFAELSYSQDGNLVRTLGLRIHHALYDGVSLPNLLADLRECIGQQFKSPEVWSEDLPRNGLIEFALRSYEVRRTDVAKQFWLHYLNGVKETSRPRSALVQGERTYQYRPKLFRDGESLVALSRIHGLSIPSIVFAVYARMHAQLFHHHLDQYDNKRTIIGVYMANRDHDEENLSASPTVNLLPLCVDTAATIAESARNIQKDLAEIGDSKNINVSLHDIFEWTGVAVDTFVNYLQLPGRDDDFRLEGTQGSFSLEQKDKKSMSIDGEGPFDVPTELKGSSVKRAYPPSIDVEVALRHGALDVGIFGPVELLSESTAENLLNGLHDSLVQLSAGLG